MSLHELQDKKKILTQLIQECSPVSKDYLVRMNSLLAQLDSTDKQIKALLSPQVASTGDTSVNGTDALTNNSTSNSNPVSATGTRTDQILQSLRRAPRAIPPTANSNFQSSSQNPLPLQNGSRPATFSPFSSNQKALQQQPRFPPPNTQRSVDQMRPFSSFTSMPETSNFATTSSTAQGSQSRPISQHQQGQPQQQLGQPAQPNLFPTYLDNTAGPQTFGVFEPQNGRQPLPNTTTSPAPRTSHTIHRLSPNKSPLQPGVPPPLTQQQIQQIQMYKQQQQQAQPSQAYKNQQTQQQQQPPQQTQAKKPEVIEILDDSDDGFGDNDDDDEIITMNTVQRPQQMYLPYNGTPTIPNNARQSFSSLPVLPMSVPISDHLLNQGGVIDLTDDTDNGSRNDLQPPDKKMKMEPNAEPIPAQNSHNPNLFREIYNRMIYPKLSNELKTLALSTIKFLDQRLKLTSQNLNSYNMQWASTDHQIRTLRAQQIRDPGDIGTKLRLQSLLKSSKILWVQKAITSKNIEMIKDMQLKLFKGAVNDYRTFFRHVVDTIRQGDERARLAVEHMTVHATSNDDATLTGQFAPPVGEPSSFSTLSSLDARGVETYEPMDILDRKKIEQLLDNIQADIEIKPGDRRGTPEELKITLLEHQKVGLTWLQKMEETVKGGILADDMGLGKTIQAMYVSLIFFYCFLLLTTFSSLIVANKPTDPKIKTTLIVAPVALLKQWEREIETRLKPEHQLSVLIYHGAAKKANIKFKELAQYDIVLTTYGLLSREYKEHFGIESKQARKKDIPGTHNSPFYQSDSVWFRVVLDEAQYIKNKNTLSSKACSSLESTYRWCLSGTPMQNSVLELYSLLRFLQIKPYDDEQLFNRDIGNPIVKYGNRDAMRKLQALLKAILLRRTKSSKIDDKPILQLPPKDIQVVNSEMDDDEEEFYHALERGAQEKMNKYINSNTLKMNYSNVLVLLLRLRQACCHPKLIERANRLKASKIISGRSGRKAIKLCRRLTSTVVRRLSHMHDFTCPKCYDAIDKNDVVIFYPCGDIICADCSTEFFDFPTNFEDSEASRCPSCNVEVKDDEMINFSIFDLVHLEQWTDQEILSQHRIDKNAVKQQANDYLNHQKTDRNRPMPQISVDSDTDDSDFNLFEKKETSRKRKPKTEDEYIPPVLSATTIVGDALLEPGDRGDDSLVLPTTKNEDDELNTLEKQQKDNLPLVSANNKYFLGAKVEPTIEDELSSNSLLSPAPIRSEMSDLFPNGWISSCKIEKCLEIINNVRENFPGEKIIIFSQFTSLLDFMEIALDQANQRNYLRYDGSMTAANRHKVVLDFFDKSELDLLLISLKAGNVGLTLTCASHIVIMDPFWNPFVEEQAMDRAHRIGQIRPVFVHKLVIEGTVEDRILDLQQKKKEMINSALDENEMRSIGRLNQQELMYLFGLRSNH